MKYIGRHGEYLVLLNLLKEAIEAYLAIKVNQEDYDITVVLNKSCVKRIQVKSTELSNRATNNSISGTEKDYDYLVLVIVDDKTDRVFILIKEEATKAKGSDKQLGTSQLKSGVSVVKESLLEYEGKWEKIKNV